MADDQLVEFKTITGRVSVIRNDVFEIGKDEEEKKM